MVRGSYVVAIGLIVACSGGGSSDAPFAVPPSTNPGIPKGPPQLVVENRTDTAVLLHIRSAPQMQIDRRVLLGDLSVPIGPVAFIPLQTEVVQAGSSTVVLNTVGVIDVDSSAAGAEPVLGAILGFEKGPGALAIGAGTVFVRKNEDGSLTVEAEDPRAVTLLPVERDMPACGEDDIGTRVDGLPSPAAPLHDVVAIASVVREPSGCRVFDLTRPTDPTPALVRACLPDEAFPFAAEDALTIRPVLDPTIPAVRIENEAGVAVELLHLKMATRESTTVSSISIAADLDTATTCATIDPAACGDVTIPALTVLDFAGSAVRRPALRTAIPDPREPKRNVYVLGASARPVAMEYCDERPKDPLYGADVFVAIVER